MGRFVLKNYAPVTARYGFHFASYEDYIFTPVIRQEVRQLTVTDKGHFTVYLPAYDDDRLHKILSRVPNVRWEVFSKHNAKPVRKDNVSIWPVNNELFIASLASCTGILCGAGFETPAEALYLGKKLMVIPMKNQFEQQCNAAALEQMGVPVLKSLKKKYVPAIHEWTTRGQVIPVNYPDITEKIIDRILEDQVIKQPFLATVP